MKEVLETEKMIAGAFAARESFGHPGMDTEIDEHKKEVDRVLEEYLDIFLNK